MVNDFWELLDHLVQISEVVIDRPQGSTHPRFPDSVYPLNYGYLKNAESGDGAALDVWVGSLPSKSVEEIVCTIDLNKNDLEIKILMGCSEAEAQTILDFHNTGNMRAILVRR
jgi:inorganic pyrophosphatase